MKKFIAIPLVAVMLAALAVPALAEEGSANATISTEPTAITVQGKYDGGTTTATVFSVDIKWGSMKAVYSPNRSAVWNPDTLTEETIDAGSSHWRWEQGTSSDGLKTNEIAITNRSNAPVTCTFDFQAELEFDGITATVHSDDATEAVNTFGIRTAQDAVAQNKVNDLTRSGFVTLSGELRENQASDFTKIGTLCVTLKETGT